MEGWIGKSKRIASRVFDVLEIIRNAMTPTRSQSTKQQAEHDVHQRQWRRQDGITPRDGLGDQTFKRVARSGLRDLSQRQGWGLLR